MNHIISSNKYNYCLCQVTIKIATSRIISFGSDKGLIEYGVLFNNTKGRDEVFTIKTPYEGEPIVKEFGSSWNVTGELRSDTYLDKVFKEPRRSSMYLYVEPFEWESEYNPDVIEQKLPF